MYIICNWKPFLRCPQGPFVSSSILCQCRGSNNVYTEVAKFPCDKFWLGMTNTSILVTLVFRLTSSFEVVYTKLQESPHVHITVGVVTGMTTVCKDQVLYCHYTVAYSWNLYKYLCLFDTLWSCYWCSCSLNSDKGFLASICSYDSYPSFCIILISLIL